MTGADIVLDLSRLLSRGLHATPTGVDRVEMAYARGLMRLVPDRLAFGAVSPVGGYGRVPTDTATAFLDATEARWRGEAPVRAGARRWSGALRDLVDLRPRPLPRGGGRVLIQASPHHLHREALVADILRREQARFVCLVHDLIPIDFPEYARPNGPALHQRRIDCVARQASAVIANSDATRTAFLPHLAAQRREIPVRVAPLGIVRRTAPPAGTGSMARPYFLCLGTIEPRKNHLLLLNIWRRLLTEAGAAAPLLVIVGRRGWENENIVDMLDRCPALKPGVEEHAGLSDDRVVSLIAGARALLMPSFAEGFGLPVAEALDAGVPVLCSDIPAHREVGGDAPDYLDPLDGPGWMAAINDYARPDSRRRAAQTERIARWSAPRWDAHVATVLDLADEVAR